MFSILYNKEEKSQVLKNANFLGVVPRGQKQYYRKEKIMKIIVFLLTVLLLTICLVSCKSDTTNPPEESANETLGGDVAETDNK